MRARLWAAVLYATTAVVLLDALRAVASPDLHDALLRLVRLQGYLVLIGVYASAGFLLGGELIKRQPQSGCFRSLLIGTAIGTLGITVSSILILYASAGHSIIQISLNDVTEVWVWLKISGPATLASCAISGWLLHWVAGLWPGIVLGSDGRDLDNGTDVQQHVDGLVANITGEPEWLVRNRRLENREKVPPKLAAASLIPVPVFGLVGSLLRTTNEADFMGLGSWVPIYLGLAVGAVIGLFLLSASRTAGEDADTTRLLGLIINWGVLISAVALPIIL